MTQVAPMRWACMLPELVPPSDTPRTITLTLPRCRAMSTRGALRCRRGRRRPTTEGEQRARSTARAVAVAV
eukprot:10970195-Alexandrium_andersonii.AAC.1